LAANASGKLPQNGKPTPAAANDLAAERSHREVQAHRPPACPALGKSGHQRTSL